MRCLVRNSPAFRIPEYPSTRHPLTRSQSTSSPTSNWSTPPPHLSPINLQTDLSPSLSLSPAYTDIVSQKTPSWNRQNKKGVLPPLIFGGATLSDIYNTREWIGSNGPVNTVKAALDAGINAFDTSPHYNQSESVLGHCLTSLRSIHPRESYKLITKVGRYGEAFDYSKERVRRSLERSLDRLGVGEVDLVYLHDVEFVASKPNATASNLNYPALALMDPDIAHTRGIHPEFDSLEPKIHGAGDEQILIAISELFTLKKEGKVKMVGISGLPLEVLLRISILVRHHLGRPLDYVLSYANHTVQSVYPGKDTSNPNTLTNFQLYIPEFANRGGITAGLVSASPLFMGLLTPSGPPAWHPSPKDLQTTAQQIHKEICLPANTDLATVASRFGMRPINESALPVSFCIGLSSAKEVERALDGWIQSMANRDEDIKVEMDCVREFQAKGYGGWMYPNGR